MSLFNQRFKELKEEKGVMLKDLAATLDYTSSKLSYYLNSNNAEPPYDTLIKIAEYFNVSTDYLLGISNFRNTDQEISARLISESGNSSCDEVNITLVDFSHIFNELYINQEVHNLLGSFDRITLLREVLDSYLNFCEYVVCNTTKYNKHNTDEKMINNIIDSGYETIYYLNAFSNDIIDEIYENIDKIYNNPQTATVIKNKLKKHINFEIFPSKETKNNVSYILQSYLLKKSKMDIKIEKYK